MLSLLAITGIGFFTIFSIRKFMQSQQELNPKTKDRLKKLWEVAQIAMRERKYLPAEKALLTIIKIDNKNAPAYNRLGILCAKQKEFEDALQCFEVASSIEPKPSSLHNLGLLYYETGKFAKAAIAFEKALEQEKIAARYIAYAKVMTKINDKKAVVKALEKAVELEQNPQTLSLLAEAYTEVDDIVAAEETRKKLEHVTIPKVDKPKGPRKRPKF
ncbi:tetratricopeptide repeat protein [Candidatus Saccharibacteria bacterium]|nr:tetratricopeptide repeat protein [Candidatus Saccharibacteria bacterium]